METINEHFVLTGTLFFSPRPDYPELMWRLLNRNLSASDIRDVKKDLVNVQDAKSHEVVIDIAAQVDADTQLVGTSGYLSVKITNHQLLSYHVDVYVNPSSSTLTTRTDFAKKEFYEISDTTNYKNGFIIGRTKKVINKTSTKNRYPRLNSYSTAILTYDSEDRLTRIVVDDDKEGMKGYATVGDTSMVEITDLDGNILSSQHFTGMIGIREIGHEMLELSMAKY